MNNSRVRKTRILISSDTSKGLSRLYRWFAGRHWLILGLAGIVLFFLEAYDFVIHHGDYIHVLEFVVYFTLLFVVGLLIDLLFTEIRIQTQTRDILDFKHRLSLEFSKYHDWKGLVEHITRFPGRIAPVGQACLLVSDSISGQWMTASQWNCSEQEAADLCSEATCQFTKALDPADEKTCYACEPDLLLKANPPQIKEYCLSFRYGGRVIGLLPFRLEPGESMTEEQLELMENIGDEIALALQMGQEQQAFDEMRSSETALAERREVSHYLHDHLGQNLGYLHIKMDQMILDKDRLSPGQIYDDLIQMRKAVNDSYEIVRNILETIHSETSPSLTNLLLEHARQISQRANLEIDFKTQGKPMPLPKEVQQAVFYAFEESLSNAEKHAHATKIDVLAEWKNDHFVLTIADNGIGFNPKSVDTDQHFGMEILNERMAKVNGHITLTSSQKSGTIVNIAVPNSGDGRIGDNQ